MQDDGSLLMSCWAVSISSATCAITLATCGEDCRSHDRLLLLPIGIVERPRPAYVLTHAQWCARPCHPIQSRPRVLVRFDAIEGTCSWRSLNANQDQFIKMNQGLQCRLLSPLCGQLFLFKFWGSFGKLPFRLLQEGAQLAKTSSRHHPGRIRSLNRFWESLFFFLSAYVHFHDL